MVEDFWGPSVKMVGESDFLRSLQSFDKDRTALGREDRASRAPGMLDGFVHMKSIPIVL